MAASKPTSRLLRNFHILSHLIIIWGPYLVVWALSLSTMDLSTHSLSDEEQRLAFGVLLGLVRNLFPLAHLVLYLQTSIYSSHYLNSFRGKPAIYEFWLAFHPLPQVIQRLFNVNWFGPPVGVTQLSTCSW
jgi:hypothetical protein